MQHLVSRRAVVEAMIRTAFPEATADRVSSLHDTLEQAGWLRAHPKPHEQVPDPVPPYGPIVKYLRVDDPLRRRIAELMRAEYLAEDQPSIEVLGNRHKLPYTTTKMLLGEAQTPFRPVGGYRRNRPRDLPAEPQR